jgi:hypothetical protein
VFSVTGNTRLTSCVAGEDCELRRVEERLEVVLQPASVFRLYDRPTGCTSLGGPSVGRAQRLNRIEIDRRRAAFSPSILGLISRPTKIILSAGHGPWPVKAIMSIYDSDVSGSVPYATPMSCECDLIQERSNLKNEMPSL